MDKEDVRSLVLLNSQHSKTVVNSRGNPLDMQRLITRASLMEWMYEHRHELVAAARVACNEVSVNQDRALRAAASFEEFTRELKQAEGDFAP